jgi:hypothetical protein
MVYDPNFRKEKARYFPADSTDRRIEWRNENQGYDLYEPKSAACQLGISRELPERRRQKRHVGPGHRLGSDSV